MSSSSSLFSQTRAYDTFIRKSGKLRQAPIFQPALRGTYMISQEGEQLKLPQVVRAQMTRIDPACTEIRAPFWRDELALFINFCMGALTDSELADSDNLFGILGVAHWCGASDVMIAIRDDLLKLAASGAATTPVSKKVTKMYDGLL